MSGRRNCLCRGAGHRTGCARARVDERLVSRWRFGFLLVFYVGAILALLVAAATSELAGTADWTFLLSLSIAGALVAVMFIRSALAAGRRWKKLRSGG